MTPIKWTKLSQKQLQLLSWWMDNSPYKNNIGVIAEGAVRSGKTLIMAFSFVLWSMNNFSSQQFAICGKTIGSLRRNVVTPLKDVLIGRGYKVVDKVSEQKLTVIKGNTINTYYLFGGRDERSQDLIQGITLAGLMLDEVALMPRSFVEQAMARCSVEGAKYWFNCNPEGPKHWFYVEHILKAVERKYLRIHFAIEDNLSLSKETIDRYKSMFTGIFYRRFILGEWAFADGIIYDCFNDERNTYSDREKVLPIEILEKDYAHQGAGWIGCDYGVYNPQVFLLGYKYKKPGERVPYFYIDKEYYYDGRNSMKQKSDEEYVHDLNKFLEGDKVRGCLVDPSASSLIVAMTKRGYNVLKANNDVDEGIKMVYSLLSTGHLLINTRCKNLIQELGLYIWDDKASLRGEEKPVKSNDHCCDALRYFIRTTTQKYEVL